MKSLLVTSLVSGALTFQAAAAILTVTTTNNVNVPSGQTSLSQALTTARDEDEIRFNIPGTGPFYIETPAEGYPVITNGITINGYSQPGSTPNSNPILGTNNAKILIVLDSRTGGRTTILPNAPANVETGYSPGESAVLGVVDTQKFRLQGVSMLGVPQAGPNSDVAVYFVSFARGASGQISGCWLGVDPNGQTVAGALDGVTGFRYRAKDATGTVTNELTVDNLVLGVAAKATNAVQQFNVIVGMPGIPIIVEGTNTRISGNFITVLPDGLHDFNVGLDSALQGNYGGSIEIGRGGNSTLIGTDGDGVNDENERNVMGGGVPRAMGGYDHLIEFYGQNPGTNIVLAGNYIGVGIDGKTKFTNGIPVLNGGGASAQYRIGSDLNGTNDVVEGNLIANNYPTELFPPSGFAQAPDALNFFDELSPGAAVSLRGNSLINNFPFPASPLRDGGTFLGNYYAQVLADPTANVFPVLTNSTRTAFKGTVPLVDTNNFGNTQVDIYIADPAGLTNGVAAGIPELPQGFVQGLTFLGTFEEGSAADLDKKPGAFQFDISKLNVPAGSQLTVTANYVPKAPVAGGGEASITSITRTQSGISIVWTGGGLQSASAVTGPWTTEPGATSPYEVPASGQATFFRAQGGGGTGPTTQKPPLTSPFSNAITVQ